MYSIIPIIWFSLATFILGKLVKLSGLARVALSILVVIFTVITLEILSFLVRIDREHNRVLTVLWDDLLLVGTPIIYSFLVGYSTRFILSRVSPRKNQ